MEFTVKNGFKVAFGAYLGWNLMKSADLLVGKVLGSFSDVITDVTVRKIEQKVYGDKYEEVKARRNSNPRTYGPRREYQRPVRTEAQVGDATDV